MKIIEKAARLIEENARSLRETSCLGDTWYDESDKETYMDWVATARELRGLGEQIQAKTKTGENQ